MNLDLAKSINIDNVSATKNRVYRIGIELEGGWNKLPAGVSRLEHDGSVRLGRDVIESGRVHIGELPSPPLEPDKFEDWMRKHYPDYVNQTCGMHVHQSFKSALTYQRLMTPAYPATVVSYVGKWAKRVGLPKDHCLWPRLKGDSRYCQHLFNADEQVTQAEKAFNQDARGHRYTVVNYCWSRYQTLEIRLLPAMPDVDTAISAVREVIDITNRFLIATAKKEEKLRVSVPLDEEQEIERASVRV